MCNCARTSFDILHAVNAKRAKAGMPEVSYDWIMVKWRTKAAFFRPYRQIGKNYVWDAKTSRQIINALWKLRYTPHISWRHLQAA